MKTLFLAGVICAFAEAQSWPEPPPLIRLIRSPLPDSGAPQRYAGSAVLAMIGMSALTGPAETWLMEAHDSFAALEQTDRALRPLGSGRGLAGESLGGAVAPAIGWVAVHRSWLSYRPLEANKMLAKMRYLQALVFYVRPEAEDEFVGVVKARKVSLDGINLDRPEMAYQVISGARTITFLFLAPLASLKSLDEGLARTPAYARPAARLAAAGNVSHEHFLLRVEPGLSMVPDHLVEGDPAFWRPR